MKYAAIVFNLKAIAKHFEDLSALFAEEDTPAAPAVEFAPIEVPNEAASAVEEAPKKKGGRPKKVTTTLAPASTEEMSEEEFRAVIKAYAARKGASGLPNVVAARQLLQKMAGKDMVKDVPPEKRAEIAKAASEDI
jgi:hypothetical protein